MISQKLKAIKDVKAILKSERFILTGGSVMSIHGLKKENNDVDIILVKPDPASIETAKRMMEQNPCNSKPYEGQNFLIAIFEFGGQKFDVFVYDVFSKETLVYEGLETTSIAHIIQAKKGMNRMKDWLQLRKLAKSIFSQDKFEEYMDRHKI